MKKLTLVIIFKLMILSSALCQYAGESVQYQKCNAGCDRDHENDPLNGTYTYSTATSYITEDITSDFSMRKLRSSPWHKGVDYKRFNVRGTDGDLGDAIVAMDNGTVKRIVGTHNAFKYLTVDYGGDKMGYGHIFWTNKETMPPPYFKSGKFILKRCDPPRADYFAIINTQTGDAISDYVDMSANGNSPAFVTNPIDGSRIQVTNQVTADQAIAPIGDSGTGDSHVHLYRFRNTAGSHTIKPITEENTCDPLEIVEHVKTEYEFSIHSENTTTNSQNLILKYPGTQSQSFRVRAAMKNAKKQGERFENVTMNLDEVGLYINKEGESADLIKGAYFNSRINLGARKLSAYYPANVYNQIYGNWVRTGQSPGAYSGQDYDDFYFSDFVSRLSKYDGGGSSNGNGSRTGEILYADIPEHSEYEDGNYQLTCRGIDVRGESFREQLNTPEICLDNFMPYVTEFEFSIGNSLVYKSTRLAFDENLSSINDGFVLIGSASNPTSHPMPGTYDLNLKVEFSEPMSEASVQYEGESFMLNPLDAENKNFYLTLNDRFLDEGHCPKFEIKGLDCGNNPIINVYSISDGNQSGRRFTMPTRQSKGSGSGGWTNYPAAVGLDKFVSCITNCHEFSSPNALSCAELNNLNPIIQNPSCKGSFGSIDMNFPEDPEEFEWFDEDGNSLSSSYTLDNLSPGIYCYYVASDCCTKEDCIEIRQSSLGEDQFSHGIIGNLSHTTNLSYELFNADPSLLPVDVEFVDMETGEIIHEGIIATPPGQTTGYNAKLGKRYCAFITDANDCVHEHCLVVEGQSCYVTNELEIALLSSTNEINGASNGSISIDVIENSCNTGMIEWSHGATGAFVEGLSAGEYCVTVTGEESCDHCYSVKCFEIINEDPCPETNPIEVLDYSHPICNSVIVHEGDEGEPSYVEYVGSPGWIWFRQISGGHGNYSYTWSDGSTGTAGILVYEPGNYCVTITDECDNKWSECYEINLISTDHYCIYPPFYAFAAQELGYQLGDDMGIAFEQAFSALKANWNNPPDDILLNGDLGMNLVSTSSSSISYEIGFTDGRVFGSANYERIGAVSSYSASDTTDSSVADWELFPNPAMVSIFVDVLSDESRTEEIRIYNTMGEIVYFESHELQKGKNRISIDISELPSGTYFMNHGGRVTKRFVKID